MQREALLHGLAAGFALQKTGARFMLAESCTGGLISAWMTEIAGSSHWFDGAVVSYSNAVKSEVLEVKPATLRVHGAVSLQTALEMAEGARRLHRRVALRSSHGQDRLTAASVTGIAGPTGALPDKPTGLVCMAWSGPFGLDAETHLFKGSRGEVRHQAACLCLAGLVSRLFRR